MVLIAGSTGLRRGEWIALRWQDIDFVNLQADVTRSIWRNRVGETKTEASKKPVPLHPAVVRELIEWRKESPYNGDGDFLFPSVQLNGRQPLQPDMILKRHLRPALEALGIKKQIGWHSFRHGLATMLRQQGVDLKLAQAMLRHANSRITLEVYQQVVGTEKRDAQQRVMEVLFVPKLKGAELQHPSAPSIANLLSESCP